MSGQNRRCKFPERFDAFAGRASQDASNDRKAVRGDDVRVGDLRRLDAAGPQLREDRLLVGVAEIAGDVRFETDAVGGDADGGASDELMPARCASRIVCAPAGRLQTVAKAAK